MALHRLIWIASALVTVVGVPYLIYLFVDAESIRGRWWLVATTFTTMIHPVAYVLASLTADQALSVALFDVYVTSRAASGILWFGFLARWTGRPEWTTPRRMVAVFGPFVALTGTLWVGRTALLDGVRAAWYPTTEQVAAGGLTVPVVSIGPLYAAWQLYSLAAFLLSMYFLVEFTIRPEQRLYRRQNVLIILAAAGPAFVTLAFQALEIPVKPAPLTNPIAVAMTATAVLRFGRFEVVPLARGSIIEEIDGGILVFDTDRRVIDSNALAREVLGLPEDVVGMSLGEVLAASSRLADPRTADGGAVTWEQLDGDELTTDGESGRRHYSVSVSSLTDSTDQAIGTGLLLYDVTEQRRSREELALLKQVQSRILRHNLRNELTVIRNHADMLERDLGDRRSDARGDPGRIVQQVDELVDVSNKARRIERIVDRDGSRTRIDLAGAVDSAVDRVAETYPAVTFDVDVPEGLAATGHDRLPLAIENAVENAAEHNDAADPRVSISATATDGTVTLEVTDNGPGIPDHELAALEREEETKLSHGSGAGLWLVQFVIDRSGGELHVDASAAGTTVRFELDRAEA